MNSYLASKKTDPDFDHLFEKALMKEKLKQIDKEYEVKKIQLVP